MHFDVQRLARNTRASAAPPIAATSLDPADTRLIALADAVEALERACDAHTAAHRGENTDESDAAFDTLTSGFSPIEEEIAATPAATMLGVMAKARAAQVPTARAFDDCPFALSIADDLWRLSGNGVILPTVPAASPDSVAAYPAEIMTLYATIKASEDDSPEAEEAWRRWNEIDGLVLRSRPTTLAGVIGMLERREHHQFNIEDRPAENVGTDDKLIQHALVSALAFLREVVDLNAVAEQRPSMASAA